MSRRWLGVGLLVMLVGCSRLAPSQLAGTAAVLGCWPYGFEQPPPTATNPVMLSPPSGTGTPLSTLTASPTAAPTMPSCTPAPNTPTLTPSPTPSPTPWTRPTAAPPGGKDTPPLNLSNMPGYDQDPAIAVHSTEGWAAVVWANWLNEFPTEASVIVKVQDPATKTWRRGLGVNTGAVTKGAGAPAIAIDPQGRIHVVFAQNGQVVITTSADAGRTWTIPNPIPLPSGSQGGRMFQLVVDAAGQLHLFLISADRCFDCYHAVHAQRASDSNGPWTWQDWLIADSKQLYGDIATVPLPNGTIRTVVAIGVGEAVRIVTQDGRNGAWVERPRNLGGLPIQPQVVAWIDLMAFTDAAGQSQVCVSWGQYSKSGLFVACSRDAGLTWDVPEVLAYHAAQGAEPTPDPAAPTPALEDNPNPSEGSGQRGFHPELLYEPSTDNLMAVWSLLDGSASTLVYSYRPAQGGAWFPVMTTTVTEPALGVFGATRRSAARNPRVAFAGHGVAMVTWMEIERDENLEVYVGGFLPATLLTRPEN
ncbi:sialidase/neuraminidase family protein [Herpetosiphon geysericola]|uniref:Sialidase domain-containing protein n=1 Tax=Herpetosiphon geysericola TaxID=70996 RepID=A0A0P6YKJ1_9CHLR|nr:hypothetical protein [Herpetosiphon geysericola]KPL83011.1 hypothetical protein SE18_19395 [Herpetosiphon geysericola]